MLDDWIETTLGDVLTLQRGFDLPINQRIPGTIPVVASNGVVGSHNKAKVKRPGVLIGRSGSIGGAQFIKTDFWALNTTLYVKDFKGNDPRFIYYLLLNIDFKKFNVGSGVPTLNRNHIHPLPISVPPLPEQKAIARILSSLDDKIELNQEMNRTLEAQARAIFKSWFVDFDPVRAKMEGRQPVGMDAATAALFPDAFEESELGLILKGWRIKTITELAEVTSGKRPNHRSSLPTPEMKIPLYGGGGIMAYVAESLYTQPILATGRVGTLGLVFRIYDPCWMSDNTLVILSKDDEVYEYLYFQLKEVDFQSLNRGSTQPLVTQSDLKKQLIIIPDRKILKIFHSKIAQFFLKVNINEQESQVLANLRDFLLPKLMSGEIRVKEAEKMVGEAT